MPRSPYDGAPRGQVHSTSLWPRAWVILVIGSLSPTQLTAQDPDATAAKIPSSAELRGRVASRYEAPLAGAEITLVGTGRSVLTDSTGRFVFRSVLPGEYVVRIRRIGFNAQILGAQLAAGETKDVTIVLEPGTYQLPDVEVTARSVKPIEYAWTTKYDDFFRRKRVGLGHYISRADIQQRQPWKTPSLLHGIPGARIRFRHPGMTGTDVWFTGCANVSVWIDGWKQNPKYYDVAVQRRLRGGGIRESEPSRAAINGLLLDRLFPSQIEMIEVYASPAEMPAEFLDDSCAAIAIWTR